MNRPPEMAHRAMRAARLALLLVPALLAAVTPARAFERWRAQKRFEISGAENIPLNQPSDILVSPAGLFVLDGMNSRICKFDAGGRLLEVIRGGAEASFSGALGLARDERGTLYVADAPRGRVLAVSAGSAPRVLAELERGEGEKPPDPAGILFFDGRLYVADNDNHQVRILGIEGAVEGKFGGLGEGPGLFKYPYRLAVDPKGRVAVTDVINCRVQLFTPKGEFLAAAGRPGTVSGTFFRPGGLAIDREGMIWVADGYFGSVQVFAPDGQLAAVLTEDDGTPLELRSPTALGVTPDALYVVETGASRVSVFAVERVRSR